MWIEIINNLDDGAKDFLLKHGIKKYLLCFGILPLIVAFMVYMCLATATTIWFVMVNDISFVLVADWLNTTAITPEALMFKLMASMFLILSFYLVTIPIWTDAFFMPVFKYLYRLIRLKLHL